MDKSDFQSEYKSAHISNINLECAKAPFKELQRFFASGNILVLENGFDLIEVAYQMSQDNASYIKGLMDDESLYKIKDEQASKWLEADNELWTLVIKPWIMVQESK